MRKSILIVDDSEDTREPFKATLEVEGFAVVEAGTGQQALEILKAKSDFSLLLLDISMPEMNGFEVLQQMERQKLGHGIPVMLVSAVKNLGSLPLPPNVIDTLKKPFFYPELVFKIKQVHGLLPNAAKFSAEKSLAQS